MLNNLKIEVCAANIALFKRGLSPFTWGNVSGIDREKGIVVIKPSGVPFDDLSPDNMVCVNLEGKTVNDDKKTSDNSLKPSSDLPTHIELYKAFPEIGGVIHTHSRFATAFAQAAKPICLYGTTHADFAAGEIPCTWEMRKNEVENDYEKNTGLIITEYFSHYEIDYKAIPAVLVSSHGPFAWGNSPKEVLEAAATLEYIAELAYYTEMIANVRRANEIPEYLKEKHYKRKHGENAYYGQK